MIVKSAIGVALALSFSFVNPCSQEFHDSEPKDKTIYEVNVQYPEFVSIPKSYEVSGTLGPAELYYIASTANGTIDQVLIGVGDTVSPDDPVISIASNTLIEAIDIKRAKIREYQAKLKDIQDKLDLNDGDDRPVSFEESGFLDEEPSDAPAQKEFGSAAATQPPRTLKNLADVLEASIERLGKEADKLDRQLLELNLTSPVQGVVTKQFFNEGNPVKEQDRLVEIAQISPLNVVFQLPEEVANFVDKHSQVKVRPFDAPEQKYTGQVNFVSPNLSDDKTIEIRAHVNNIKGLLKGGQKAKVFVDTRKINKVILLPQSTLYQEDDKSYVFIVYRNRAKQVEVTVGDDDGKGNIQIFGDLRVDDPVILDRPPGLKHNSWVKIPENPTDQ